MLQEIFESSFHTNTVISALFSCQYKMELCRCYKEEMWSDIANKFHKSSCTCEIVMPFDHTINNSGDISILN